MDRISNVVRWQWRGYWRRFARGGKLSTGNQGFVLIIAGLISFKYALKLRVAAVELAQGRTLILEALLAGIFAAWVVAFLTRDLNDDCWRRARSLPLSLKELFAIRLASLLMPPYAWMVLAGSLAIAYPLWSAPRPLLGILAALIFIIFAVAMGVSASQLLSVARWRRILALSSVVLVVIVSIYVIQSPWPPRFMSVSSLPPLALVARAATAGNTWTAATSLGSLVVLMVLGLGAAVSSFRLTLNDESGNSARRLAWSFNFPGQLSGLVAKDLRYFRRLLDVYFGLLAVVVACIYLITVDVASTEVSIIFLTMIFLPNCPLAFNYFGLEGASGLDRYKLLPLAGKKIVLSKNLAFAAFCGMQISPVLLLVVWRLGITAGLIGLMTSASLACAYLAWGNWMSLSHPVKMHFFRFSSSSASIFDAMAGIMFASAPAILIIYFLNNSRSLVALVPLAFGVMYIASVLLAARRFPVKVEKIERALA